MLFPTSLVGSYPQPDWLIDRARLADRFPPRVRARELWRVDPAHLEQAQDDATLLAIHAQEQAGLDILTDGEERRESYSNRFATALDGVDIDNPGTALDRSGHPNPVPRVTGPIRRRHPVEVEDLNFLRAHTGRSPVAVKITVPNGRRLLRPGMIAEARIQQDGQVSAITIPASAIVRDADGATQVFAYNPADKRVYARRITVGTVYGKEVEVLAGLTSKEMIVVGGQHRIREGSKVEATTAKTTDVAVDSRKMP